MNIWQKEFEATYITDNGVVVLDDASIPLPPGYIPDPKLRSTVMFPPGTRAGDHYHQKREELFVGFGEGMELLIEDPKTKKVSVLKMDPKWHQEKCIAYWMQAGMPHAVRNIGRIDGYLIEFASNEPEKVEYKIIDNEG